MQSNLPAVHSRKRVHKRFAFVIGFLLVLFSSFQASAQVAAPTKITFSILNTCGSGDTYSFSLNGTSLGSVGGNSSGNCTCDATLQTFTVNNAALLASAWSASGSNTIRVKKTTSATYFAWVSAKLDFASGSSRAYYDYNGGDATEPNLCNAQYSSNTFDQALTPASTVIFYRDIDGDGFGDPNTTTTVNTNNSLTPVAPPTGFVTNSADCEDNNPTIPSQTPCLAKPFNKTAGGYGFTQELVASVPNTGWTSGYGFDPHGNVYTISLDNQHLYKTDLSTTIPGPGGVGTVHPITDLGILTYRSGSRAGQTTYGGNFTQYPDGTVYLNTWDGKGVVQVDLETASITSDPIQGAPGGTWGIGVDPQLNSRGHHNIWYQSGGGISVIDPVDHVYLGSMPIYPDGLAIDATGNFLFAAQGFAVYKRILPDPASGVPNFQLVGNYGGSPDGMAFAVIGTDQVVVSNDAGAKTVTLWKFPNNDFTKAPTPTVIASEPVSSEYGDMANVGPDGYLYITYWYGTRFPDGSTNGNASIVRFGPAGRFLPPTHSDNLSLTPATDTKPIGDSVVLTATLATTDLSTNQTVPLTNTSVTFKVVGGPDNGQTYTGNTDANGNVSFTLVNRNGAGDDVVHAQFVDGNNNTQTSNNAVIKFICIAPAFTSSPGNQSANTAANSCANNVTYSSTESVTGSPTTTITYAFTGATAGSGNGNGSGSSFNKGVTTVTLTATNSCGSATSTFTVTVTDNVAPVAKCKNISVAIGSNLSASIAAAAIDGGSFDNCGSVTLSTSGQTSYGCADIGRTIPVTLIVTDANGLTSSCTANVTVTDPNMYCNRPPVARCKPVTVNANTTCQGTAIASAFNNGSFDPDNDAISISISPAGPFALGVTPVTLTVTDAKGASSSCTTTITVIDGTPPALIIPASITVTAPVGQCSIAASGVTLGNATATDNCSGVVSISNNAPAVYPVGTTIVAWKAVDAAGVISIRNQMVNVVSSNPPILAATTSIAANNDAGACGATVTVATPAASNVCANSSECDTDNIDNYTNGQVSGQSPRWTPWPESGGSAVVSSALSFSGSKSVYVSNEQDQLYLLGDKTSGKWNLSWKMYVPAGKAGYFNTQHFQTAGIEWGQQVNFNTDGTGSLQADSALTPFAYPQGQWFDVKQTFDLDADQTTLSVNGVAIHTWKFSKQANNRLGAKQLGSIDFYAYPVGVSEYYIDDITFCGGNTPVVTGVRSDNQALTATYPVGNTTITWTATDGAGHTATSTQTVTVTDNEAPVLTCPVIAQPICYAGVNSSYSIAPLVASDNCGIASTTYTVSGATTRSGSGNDASGNFSIGTSTITWTVTDVHNNTSTCTTTVTINAPVTGAIPDVYAVSPGGLVNTLYVGYGPGSVTLTAAGNGGTAPYTYHWSNGSNVASTVVSAAGTYTVTITDKYGCTTTVSKTINSIDVRCGNKNDKVLVCQKTGSAKNPWVQICIAPSAVATHLANGSTLGECAISAVTTREGVSKSAIVAEATIMAYPNPSRGVVNLRLSNYAAGKVTIQLLDGTGKAVLTEQASISYKTEDVTLGLGRLAAGVYNVRISGEKGTQFTKVVVVR